VPDAEGLSEHMTIALSPRPPSDQMRLQAA
jgi:hypothetical protein